MFLVPGGIYTLGSDTWPIATSPEVPIFQHPSERDYILHQASVGIATGWTMGMMFKVARQSAAMLLSADSRSPRVEVLTSSGRGWVMRQYLMRRIA